MTKDLSGEFLSHKAYEKFSYLYVYTWTFCFRRQHNAFLIYRLWYVLSQRRYLYILNSRIILYWVIYWIQKPKQTSRFVELQITCFSRADRYPPKLILNTHIGWYNVSLQFYSSKPRYLLIGEGYILLTRGYGFMGEGCTTPLLTR